MHWGRSGGGPQFTFDLATALVESGIDVAVSFNAEAEIAHLFERDFPVAVPVRTFRGKVGVVLRAYRLLCNGLRLRRAIRRLSTTVVICAMESVYQSLSVPLAVPRSSRYVVVLHDAEQHEGDENILHRIGRCLEVNRADAGIVLSPSVARKIREGIRWSSKPLLETVLASSLGGGETVREIESLRETKLVTVGFFGRLLPYKGLNLLLEAAALVKSQGLPVRFVVYGSGPELRLEDGRGGRQAEWHGAWVAEEDVATVLRTFDILALPYLEASQSGVLSHAMALGIPSVATPVGGVRDHIEMTGAGVLAEETSSASFAEALTRLVMVPGLYSSCSANALAAARDSCSWSRVALDICAFLSLTVS